MQDYFTYAKVFALIMIIVTGFVQLGFGHTEYFTWEGTETDPSKIGRRRRERLSRCYPAFSKKTKKIFIWAH